jgi:FRG domain
MKLMDLPNWEAFEEQIRALFADHKSGLLFRGQSNSCWPLDTTLERDAPCCLKASDYYRAMHNAKYQIESLREPRWDIMTPPDYEKWLKGEDAFGLFDLPGYDFMIHLRHHGFPSPLLDWSQSPYIAAFFAFNHASSRVPCVSIYAYREYGDQGKRSNPTKPRICGRGHTVQSHPRHDLQKSEYTICRVFRDEEWCYACHEEVFSEGKEEQDILWKFTIPSSERLKVLRALDRNDLNSFYLFGTEESLMETIAMREVLFGVQPRVGME